MAERAKSPPMSPDLESLKKILPAVPPRAAHKPLCFFVVKKAHCKGMNKQAAVGGSAELQQAGPHVQVPIWVPIPVYQSRCRHGPVGLIGVLQGVLGTSLELANPQRGGRKGDRGRGRLGSSPPTHQGGSGGS